MLVKVKENFQKKKYILRGERNVRYYDRFVSKSRERQKNNFITIVCIRMFEIICISFPEKNNLNFFLFELLLLIKRIN